MKKPNIVLDAVKPLLIERGFKKRAGHIFTIELAKDVLGCVGLNRATKHQAPGEVEVYPLIGVRHQQVERIVAECRGEKFHAYIPPTVHTPLAYLLPEARYTAWFFSPSTAAEAAEDMVSMIVAHGLPFMRSLIGLDKIQRAIDARTGYDHQLVYRRPVALLLAGDLARARQVLDESVAECGDRTDRAAVEFKKFAKALRSRL